ncbi:MAG: PQQ-binding-like beta-propeller repeat protein, partial [Verrucomicrobiae bacterium]|nr:PQQ-binding-like beta-propeller repeat protein [Verrucomicrobiae bacterium]
MRFALLFLFHASFVYLTVAAHDGTLLWQYPVGGSMSFCPAVNAEGVVYISAPDRSVHALNGETGQAHWSYPTELGVATAPVLGTDGTVYVGLLDTNIVALNGETGELLWETPAVRKASVLGLTRDSTLFAHGGYGLLLALNASNGGVVWETSLELLQASSGLALNALGECFLTAKGRLLTIDGATGDVLEEYVTDGNSTGAFYPVLAADGTACVGTWTSGFGAVDLVSQSLRWQYLTPEQWDSPSVIGPDGTVYVCTGTLQAINGGTGSLRWRFVGEGRILYSPALAADGTLYVGAEDKNLYAIHAEEGVERWRFTGGDRMAGPPTIGPNGTVYVACRDGNLYAVSGSAPLANSPWPKWQHNLANTGESHWTEGAAEVLSQSGGELAPAGAVVRLWVNAKGGAPFEYQWYRDGELIPDATENQLVFFEVGFADEGSYHAVASNALGTATTAPMEVAVGYSLGVDWYPVLGTVTGVPEGGVVTPGTEVVLEAQGTEGHEFLRWEGNVESDENPLTVVVESNLQIRARFVVEPGTLLWSATTGGEVRGSPAIGEDGTVYVGTSRGIAVDGYTGTIKWRGLPVGAWSEGITPVVDDSGSVFFSDGFAMVAADGHAGEIMWLTRGTGTWNGSNPVSVSDDRLVYLAAGSGKLLAMQAATGFSAWEVQTGSNHSSPAAL